VYFFEHWRNVIIQDTLNALTSVLFPAPCRICGCTLVNASRIPICIACLESFKPITDPMCQCCGRPFVSEIAAQASQPLCRLCRSTYYGFDSARSFAVYDEKLTSAILLLKYDQVTRLGDWFAARLAEVVQNAPDLGRVDLIAPVPLHTDRHRERGYNQAELIARPLAKRLGVKLNPRLLTRTKPRPAQLVLSRSEHWKSVRGAYAIREGAHVDKLRILLVDDVLTTGATLDACARVLKQAGAAAVMGLTVGRVASDWSPSGSAVVASSSSQKVTAQGGNQHP
jgi:ComF family protein